MSMADSELTHSKGRSRKGIATVELAVCLPLLVTLVLGFIEATNVIFLKQRLTAAAYEGVRKVTAPGQATADGVTAANAVLSQYSITDGIPSVTPEVTATTPTGTQVSVTVEAPISSNSCIGPFIIGKTLTKIQATAVMIRQ
jgi:Flp pilus assembly protein TadG